MLELQTLADNFKTSWVVSTAIEGHIIEVHDRLYETEDGKLLQALRASLKIVRAERAQDIQALKDASLFVYQLTHDKHPFPGVTMTVGVDQMIDYDEADAVEYAEQVIPLAVGKFIVDRELFVEVLRRTRPEFATIADKVGVRISSKLKKLEA